MQYTPIALGNQANPGRDPQAGDARLINCYVESAGAEGKAQLPIYACDGFASFATASASGAAGVRCLLPLSDSALIVVSGTRVMRFNSAGAEASDAAGAIASEGLVTMARNRKPSTPQIGIAVASGAGQLWFLESDTLTQFNLASLESTNLVSVSVLDGYFILFFDNGEFFVSDIDSKTIDSLNFAAAESSPDDGVISKIRGRDLVLFGTQSTEWWANTGAADFPFERTNSSDFGCYAAGSATNVISVGDNLLDTIAFAATDSQGSYLGVCYLDGYSARKISTSEVDRVISAETNKSEITSLSWSANGHTFYTISTSTQTWTYDFATGRWHQRKSHGLGYWRIGKAASFGTKVIVGDKTLARLYWMHSGLYDASNASTLTLKHSNNSGATWNATRTASIGESATVPVAVKINRLGQSKEDGKLFNLTISNAVIEADLGNCDMVVQPPTVHAYPSPVRFYGARVAVISGASRSSKPKALLSFALAQKVLS